MAAEVSGPLSQTKKITMVQSGNGEIGAAKLSGEVNYEENLFIIIQTF